MRFAAALSHDARMKDLHEERLALLRSALRAKGLAAYLVPMADEYGSEYVPASDRRVEFLSGFTGSSGNIVVTADKAAFFTDSRYTLQAERQLRADLFFVFDTAALSETDWLRANLKRGDRIGYDPKLHSARGVLRLREALAETGAEAVPSEGGNPIDGIWTDRPAPPLSKAFAHDIRWAGKDSSEKRREITAQMDKERLDAAIVSDPASVAWLLNVRGGDLPHTPLPLSRAILRRDGSVAWFIDARKLEGGDVALDSAVTPLPPEAFSAELRKLGEAKARVRVDMSEISAAALSALEQAGAMVDNGLDVCSLPKARKNAVELAGMRAAHVRDGAALTRCLAWIDAETSNGKSAITETDVAKRLEEFRAANPEYRGASFDTIAGSGPNGAIVHYRATPQTDAQLLRGSLFLLDSGGQYPDGTTDVTRTVSIGAPALEMRENFTRVLKGHIALASVKFPEGASGADLDALARRPLWEAGLDYGHGTGHGVGCYSGVHEGPQAISRRSDAPLQTGMVLSNEPGFYKSGGYGIRIENLQEVVDMPDLAAAMGRKFLGFSPLTMVPIDKRLVEPKLLDDAEIRWLDAYHAKVKAALSPLLSDDPSVARWLENATAALK